MNTKGILIIICIVLAFINLMCGYLTNDENARNHHLTNAHVYCAASFIISALG